MNRLPTGTVTFLFADIEGSTRLLQHLGTRYEEVLADYGRIMRASSQHHGGHEVDNQGDAFFFAFPRAVGALEAAIEAQRALFTQAWPEEVVVRARIGLHTGEPRLSETGYVGVDVHRAARIGHAGHGGQILLSNVTRSLIEDDLPPDSAVRDLGEHRLKDLSQPLHLFQLDVRGLPTDFLPLRSLDAFPNNLPIQLTSFVGREAEVLDVTRLLSATRLLTLTGVGGGGKTRLALQVAAEAVEEFPDGVWLVELSSLGDPSLLAQTTASILRIREQPNRDMVETLVEQLRQKRMLLIMDTCEHLLAACAQFVYTLLRHCPDLRFLATSREGLGVTGETLYPLGPLAVPMLQKLPTVQELEQFDAIRLFVERAGTRVPGFALNENLAPATVQICLRLDGLPLAIELAAARANVMSVDQLAARLDDRFHLLTGGSRTALPRHQTLRATIDWSYDLLSDTERVVFRRLAVFAGGFTLEAAEGVCKGDSVAPDVVFDVVSSLIEKSLVVADQHPREMRYRMLYSVQQYAEAKLLESGESERVRDRHLDFYLTLAEQAASFLEGPAESSWVEQLERERDNLRAALRRSDVERRAGVTLRLAVAVAPFWSHRGYWSEARGWLENTLREGAGTLEASRAKALREAGFLAWRQGLFAQAAAWSEESRLLFQRLADNQGLAFALMNLGLVARSQDDYERAQALHEESLALFRKVEHKLGVARSLGLLGIVLWYRGDYARAEKLFEESLALYRAQDNKGGMALALHGLGRVSAARENDHGATRLLNESLAIFRELGDQEGIASSLHILGRVAMNQGEYGRAKALLEESLADFRQLESDRQAAGLLNALGHLATQMNSYEQAMGILRESLAVRRRLGPGWDKWGLAECFDRLAAVAAAEDQMDRAVQIWGVADALRSTIGAPRPPADQREVDSHLGKVCAKVGKSACDVLLAQGRAMTLEHAMAFALEMR